MAKSKYPIDLGKSYGESATEPKEIDRKEKHYPTLYLDWDDRYELPDSGEMVVKFNKRRETTSKDDEGDESQSVEIEVLSIESVTADEAEPDRNDDFDKRAKRGKYEEDED